MSGEDTLDQLAWWAEEATAARAHRDDWIRRAHDEGYSLRDIAFAAGMSHAGVKKIIERGGTE